MIKKRNIIWIIILIISIIILLPIIINITKITSRIINNNKTEEIKKEIIYNSCYQENNNVKMIIIAEDTENGLEKFIYPNNELIIECNGRNKIAIDYEFNISNTNELTFIAINTMGEKIEKTILIDEEFLNNLVKIEDFTPNILNVSKSYIKINATTTVTNDEILKYDLYLDDELVDSNDNGNFKINNLDENTQYYIYVIVYTKLNISKKSDVINAKTSNILYLYNNGDVCSENTNSWNIYGQKNTYMNTNNNGKICGIRKYFCMERMDYIHKEKNRYFRV